jgi:hypothetical protein
MRHIMSPPANDNMGWFLDTGKALGVAAAVLATVGVSSGVALRVLRNYPKAMMALVLVMILGTLVAMIGKRIGWQIAGLILFFLSLGFLITLAGEASQARESPSIITSSEMTESGLTRVTTIVKADGLRMDELIYVASRGSQRVPVNAVTGELIAQSRGAGSLLGEAAFGPNAAGGVEGTFTFEVSPALFWDVAVMASRHRGVVKKATLSDAFSECIPISAQEAMRQKWGCARFILPVAPIRPAINLSVAASTTAVHTVTANVSASGVSPSKFIAVKGWSAGKSALFEQMLGPDLSGVVKATIATPVRTSSEVCVVAALIPSAAHSSPADVTRALCNRENPVPETVSIASVELGRR